MSSKQKHSFQTNCLHKGNQPDPATGAIIPPIFQTSTYVQETPGKHLGYEYTRSHNPTRDRLQECLASLEGAKFCLTTASGMSAAMLMMHSLAAGSKVLVGDDVYGGTYRLFTTVFNQFHNFKFIDTTDLELVKKTVQNWSPDLVWLETPTNPMLKISPIKGIAQACKKAKCLLLVDNTFMSPYFQNPLKLGADFVLHSMTKYINGHSDVVAGALMLNSPTHHKKLWTLQNSIGPSLSPFDSWLVLRGIKTLGVRMEAHQKNALALAEWLEAQKEVKKVIYPGLASHPQHQLATEQMSGFGGMMSLLLKGSLKRVVAFLSHLELFKLAESLGGVESLIEHPGIMTHASVPKAVRDQLGISHQLIRLSVGIEDLQDLKADLARAFKQLN